MNYLRTTSNIAERQFLLRKLTYLNENIPTVPPQATIGEEFRVLKGWVSQVGALLKRLDPVNLSNRFDTYRRHLNPMRIPDEVCH